MNDYAEEINNLDEIFFEKLPETPNSKELKNINKQREISDKELIDEIIKKKDNKKFIKISDN